VIIVTAIDSELTEPTCVEVVVIAAPVDVSVDVLPVDVGADVLPVDVGADVLLVDVGADVLLVDVGADVLLVDVGADVLLVDVGSDVLLVDVGSDVLLVDVGADVLLVDVVVVLAVGIAVPDVPSDGHTVRTRLAETSQLSTLSASGQIATPGGQITTGHSELEGMREAPQSWNGYPSLFDRV
jgi:hypothetical protein